MTRSHRVSHGLLKATALALLSAYAGAASHGGHEPECSLPPNIRPVVQVNGFGSGVLFDQSAEPFRVAFPDLDPGPNDGFFGSPEADLSLPLTWNAANLTQDASILGSEGAPEDMLPGLVGPVRDALIQTNEYKDIIFSLTGPKRMQEQPQVFAIVAGWEAAVGDNTTLFFPVNWDWRRDFFEQSKRVYDMVLFAKSETGCNPIVVGHSFGGLLVYTTFTRYAEQFADNVHGVLYSVTPITPMAASVGCFPGGEGLFGPDVLFSYPSFWSLINPLNSSCVNAPDGLDGEARQCMEGEIDSGVSCESGGAACGRPADFPDQQFYVPIDLQDPETYSSNIIGLTAARALAEEPPVLTEEEIVHVEFATQAAARVHEGTIGGRAAEIAEMHPPSISLSLTLDEVILDGADEPFPFLLETALECIPPEGGQGGANGSMPMCQFFQPTRNASTDGLLPSESTFFLDNDIFGDKVQVLNATRPPDFWLDVIAANLTVIDDTTISPHAVALFTAVTPVDTFVDCSKFTKTVSFTANGYPQVTDMLCSLVLRGNEAHGGMAPKGAEAMAPGSDDASEGGAAGEDGAIVTETDSAHMHGTRTLVSWSVGVSIAVALAGLGM